MADTVTKEETAVIERTAEETSHKTQFLPQFHVILLNDDDHTFDYVIDMLHRVFGHHPITGYKMALEVHTEGRVIVLTTHKEKAEFKQDQIHAFGPDPRIERCKGSMSAVLEPVE